MRRSRGPRSGRVCPDGGEPGEADDSGPPPDVETASEATGEDGDRAPDERAGVERADDESGDSGPVDHSKVDVTAAGESEPADPKWEKPDPEDIPEFEVRASEPVEGGSDASDRRADEEATNPTAGMPNTAGSPGTRIKEEGTKGFVAALELCARLPDDIRLPEEAAEVVPAAVEAELENDVQAFAAAEFDNPSPHVDTLSFEELDDEIWMRLRLGIPHEAFSEFDPGKIRSHALQQLEGIF